MLQFGTDGVRGDADVDLPTEAMVALGRAVARVLRPEQVLVGRDTRESGARIEGALARGLAHEHVVPVHLGVLPTPAIAYLAAQHDVPAAIISASHNPWSDNGVKVIGAGGAKLADADEAAIERELRGLAAGVARLGGDGAPGPVMDDAGDRYVAHLVGALAGRTLGGLDVVLDCANGAAFAVGPRALRAAGAQVTVLHATPDGRNINAACGSTHPESLQQAVRSTGAALGLALDGDADRVIAVDEHGAIVDGDQIMTMTALDLHARGALTGDAVVVTVMSNLGLRRALDAAGIDVIETPVGDRHVVAAMRERGLVIGGEQSGHIVYSAHATTGDGLLTGLLVCDLVRRAQRPLSDLASAMTRYPQVLENVRVGARVDLEHAHTVWECVRAVEAGLGDSGRVLVRASGTEPLVRIMVEATTPDAAAAAARRLRAAVTEEFGESASS